MGACAFILYLLSAITGLIYLYLSWNFNFWKKRGVKGPTPKLIFGTIPCIVKGNRNLALDMQDLYEEYKKTEERFIGIFMTRNPKILVTDPSLAREILVTNFNAFRGNEQFLWVNQELEQVAPMNPFLSSHLSWKSKRTANVGGMAPNRMKQLHPNIMEICKKLLDFVKASIDNTGKTIEVKSLSYKYTTEIVANFVWGINADALKIDDKPNQIFKMSRKMLNDSFMTIGFYYLSGLVPFIRKIYNKRFYPEETDNFFSKIQKDALEMRLRNKTDRPDFLNHMIQLQEKKNISHVEMVGYSLGVFAPAFETTASIMSHALYFLTGNLKAQTKLRQEILDKLDEKDPLSYDELMELPYLDQCVSETIRIVTIISFSSRMCTEETFLENRPNHKVKIEPGMIAYIPTYAFHHDPDVYPEPQKFIPERFDNGRAKELNQKGYFLPFGDGPRICTGMRLGLLEVKAGLVEIIKNFYLKRKDESERYINPNSFILGLSGDLLIEFDAIKK